jgi:O-antigen ligase
LGVGLALSIYYLVNSGFKLKRFIIGSLFAISVAIAGFLSQGKELLDSNGRFNIWHMAMKGWWANSNKFIGTGPGTYVIYGPSIQLDEAVAAGQTSIRSAFLWMHNDWLETLFTTGFIGLGFAVAVFTTAVWTARKLPAVFTSLVVYGAMAFIQMPLRHIIFALLGTLLLLEAFSRQTEIYER